MLEHAGFLERLLLPVVARATNRGPLILAVNASGIGLNVVAGDQYVADVLPSRMFTRRVRDAAGSLPRCSRGPSRTPERSRPCSYRGTRAAPTSRACSA